MIGFKALNWRGKRATNENYQRSVVIFPPKIDVKRDSRYEKNHIYPVSSVLPVITGTYKGDGSPGNNRCD